MDTKEFISYFMQFPRYLSTVQHNISASDFKLRLNNKFRLIDYMSFFDDYNYINISIVIALRDSSGQGFYIPIKFVRIDEMSAQDEFRRARDTCNELNKKVNKSIYLIRDNIKNII